MATRMMHEVQTFASRGLGSLFLTLTYSDEFLPSDGSLSKRHPQLFMKKLRKSYGAVRFYQCGEYGEQKGRPHYHFCVFGLECPDKVPDDKSPAGIVTYASPTLNKIWGMGNVTIGDVTMESCAYVARYTMKKATDPDREDAYIRRGLDLSTGEIRTWSVIPEFGTMSRRPGLGAEWFHQFEADCRRGFVTQNGRKVPVPRYYRDKLSELDQLRLSVKAKAEARLRASDNTVRRLMTKHESARLRALRLKREL